MSIANILEECDDMSTASLSKVVTQLNNMLARRKDKTDDTYFLYKLICGVLRRSESRLEFQRFAAKQGMRLALQNALIALDNYIEETTESKDMMRKRRCLLDIIQVHVEEVTGMAPTLKMMVQHSLNIHEIIERQCPFVSMFSKPELLYQEL